MSKRATAVLAMSIGFLSTAAHGQSNQCVSCLTITPIVQLSSSAGQFVPSPLQSVLRASDGRFLVSHLMMQNTQIALYDAAGRFAGLHGLKGKGPGEFSGTPMLASGPGNSVWAIEQNRVVKLDSRLRHISTKRFEQTFPGLRKIVVPPGFIVTSARISAAQGGFFTVMVMDTNGAVMRRLERTSDEHEVSHVAPASGGGFWALSSRQPRLREYSANGQLMRSIQLANDFLRPGQGKAADRGREGFDYPPRPHHAGLMDLGNDLIVTLTTVASWEWAPSKYVFQADAINANQQFDTVIDVLDLRTGRMIARRRVAEWLQIVNGAPDLAYSTRQDGNGHVVTSIIRIQARRL